MTVRIFVIRVLRAAASIVMIPAMPFVNLAGAITKCAVRLNTYGDSFDERISRLNDAAFEVREAIERDERAKAVSK